MKKQKQLNTYIRFCSMGIQMGIAIVTGALVGRWLDKKFPNKYQIWTIVCSLLAVFGSLFSMIYKVISASKKNDR